MSKKKGPVVARTKVELRGALCELVERLVSACAAFDAGKHHFAQDAAVHLANLLYGNDKAHAGALLQQLGIRENRFADTAWPMARGARIPQCCLAALQVNTEAREGAYLPMLSHVPEVRWVRFVDWWSAQVVIDLKGRTYSRMELVMEVRDSEGSHVDGELTEKYADFKRGSYLGWTLKDGDEMRPIAAPHYACIRQIGHEALLTLQQIAPDAFSSDYSFSAQPLAGVPGFSVGAGQLVVPTGYEGDSMGLMIHQPGSSLRLTVGASPSHLNAA